MAFEGPKQPADDELYTPRTEAEIEEIAKAANIDSLHAPADEGEEVGPNSKAENPT